MRIECGTVPQLCTAGKDGRRKNNPARRRSPNVRHYQKPKHRTRVDWSVKQRKTLMFFLSPTVSVLEVMPTWRIRTSLEIVRVPHKLVTGYVVDGCATVSIESDRVAATSSGECSIPLILCFNIPRSYSFSRWV